MEHYIEKMQQVVELIYDGRLSGTSILKCEEEFETLFRILDRKYEQNELSPEESLEFLCLEYEYELFYCYQYSSSETLRGNCVRSFLRIAKEGITHERMERLVNKIFRVSDSAVRDQRAVFSRCSGKKRYELLWAFEAYGKEYAERGDYGEALDCFWKALDGYVTVAESGDRKQISKTFYDGKALIYISDLIYRIYYMVQDNGLWEQAEAAFSKRQKRLMGYGYFCNYYAGVLYNNVKGEGKKDKLKLKKALRYLDMIGDEGLESTYELKCAVLYELDRLEEVVECCKSAAALYPESEIMGRMRSFAFVADIRLLYECLSGARSLDVPAIIGDAVSQLYHIPVSVMDGAKCYLPIFRMFQRCSFQAEQAGQLCLLFLELLERTECLRKSLVFRDEGKTLGYYTGMASLYYLLSDEAGEVKYRLSVFDARHMNDPNEGHVLEQYIDSDSGQLAEAKCSLQERRVFRNTFTFLKSFTAKIDSLPMWVQYADDGRGCLIIVDPGMFEEGETIVKGKKDAFLNGLSMEDDYHLYHVAYFNGKEFHTSSGKNVTGEVNEIKRVYEKIISQWSSCDGREESQTEVFGALDSILSRVKYLIKKDDYINEDEIRVMFFRNGDEADLEQTQMNGTALPRIFIRSKVSTRIKEIVLGPKVRNGLDATPYIYRQTGRMNQGEVLVSQSGIDYV